VSPKGWMDFITDVARMEADMLVCALAKVDPSHLIAGEGVRHLEKICGHPMNRMAGELHQIQGKDFVLKRWKRPPSNARFEHSVYRLRVTTWCFYHGF
jgi:hypothetical protein